MCYQTWCGPCRRISPYFEQLSSEYDDVIFLKIDVDENEAVAGWAGVSAMPTFQAYKNGAKIGEVVGASEAKVKSLIEDNK